VPNATTASHSSLRVIELIWFLLGDQPSARLRSIAFGGTVPSGIIGVQHCSDYMNLAKKSLRRLLVVSVTCLSIHSARAEMIATEQAVTVSAQASRQALLAYLGRADVASQLHSLGVERTFAAQRVAAISDEEIDTLIGKLSSLPAAGQMTGGGTTSGGYGGGGSAFLAVLLLALLVVWVIYIATPRSPAKTLNSSF